PGTLANIPEENRSAVASVVSQMKTDDGRAQITEKLRDEAKQLRGGFAQARDKFAGGELGNVLALSEGVSADTTLNGTRSPAPPTTGANVPYDGVSGVCNAPGGPGELPAPAGLVPDQMLTPEHDVYANFYVYTGGIAL